MGAHMKKVLLLVLALIVYCVFLSSLNSSTFKEDPFPLPEQDNGYYDAVIARAFSNRESDLQVYGQGVVLMLLPDDNNDSRHQRFIIRLSSGQTLLIAHNIDLAPGIDTLRTGDTVQFYGEYEWNEKGGVIHWTHNDPDGSHVAGWLQHQGQRYQ